MTSGQETDWAYSIVALGPTRGQHQSMCIKLSNSLECLHVVSNIITTSFIKIWSSHDSTFLLAVDSGVIWTTQTKCISQWLWNGPVPYSCGYMARSQNWCLSTITKHVTSPAEDIHEAHYRLSPAAASSVTHYDLHQSSDTLNQRVTMSSWEMLGMKQR